MSYINYWPLNYNIIYFMENNINFYQEDVLHACAVSVLQMYNIAENSFERNNITVSDY